MKNRIISILTIPVMALAAVSCTKYGLFGRGDRQIRAVVSASSARTRSGMSGESGRLIGCYALDGIKADSLCIAVYEFDNSSLPQGLSGDAGLTTKGLVTTNATINQDGQQFRMDAWLESDREEEDAHFMKESTATFDGTDWNLACASPSDENWNLWRNEVPTNFWAMYPATLSSVSLEMPGSDASDEAQKTLSFDYTLTPGTDDDAENQQDLCFAYSRKQFNGSNGNKVALRFYHALSAVYFDISGVKNTITVNKIGFNNVPSSAHCEITGTPGNPGVLSDDNITWTPDPSSLTSFSQAYTSSDFDTNSRVRFDESEKIFMMIPGTLDDDAELWAEFEVDGNPAETKSVNISKNSNGINYVWKPGKYYVYRLVYNGSGELGLRGSLSPYAPDWF